MLCVPFGAALQEYLLTMTHLHMGLQSGCLLLQLLMLLTENLPLRDYIELETERHSRVGASADTKEAFVAFVEKREPKFQGR